MPNYEEYSVEWVADVIEQEGIGYGLTSYFELHNIKDCELRELCLKVEESINEVEHFLREYKKNRK
jgi:hypothetical protein